MCNFIAISNNRLICKLSFFESSKGDNKALVSTICIIVEIGTKAFVQSVITYGSGIWNGCFTHLYRINRKNSIYFFKQTYYDERHTTPLAILLTKFDEILAELYILQLTLTYRY